MSFHIDDEELRAHATKGARVVGAAPPKPPTPKAPEPEQPLVKEMLTLAAAVTLALNRPAPPVSAPSVHVAAPHVTLHPELKRDQVRVWEVEITERDNTAERKIKRLKFTAVE